MLGEYRGNAGNTTGVLGDYRLLENGARKDAADGLKHRMLRVKVHPSMPRRKKRLIPKTQAPWRPALFTYLLVFNTPKGLLMSLCGAWQYGLQVKKVVNGYVLAIASKPTSQWAITAPTLGTPMGCKEPQA